MQIIKIIETCIYTSDLEKTRDFYINILGLQFISEEKGRHVFLKAGKSMLLIFNPNSTLDEKKSIFPIHGINSPPSVIHLAFEINNEDYHQWLEKLREKEIIIEKEIEFEKEKRSIYFRDPSGNLVELITQKAWPVDE